MAKLRAIALLLGAASLGPAQAEQPVHWYTQVENDVFASTDRWYTSGIRIARTHRLDGRARAEFGIVQEIYTPDPRRDVLIDRPYAARLFLSAARHDYQPGLFRTLELGAGVRGPSAYGRQSTELIHRVIPALEFDWSEQLPNRFDGQVIAVQTHDFRFSPAHAAGWAAHYGAVVGTDISFAHVGAEIRTGGAHAIASPVLRFATTPPIADRGEHGWSGFAGASARWVARNALLSRNADRFGPAIERERAVYRFAAGIAWSTGWGAFTFSGVQDSREFETQRRPHRFGSVGLRLDFL